MKNLVLKNITKKLFALFGLFLIFGLSFNNAVQAESYDFASSSGLSSTGQQAGYEAAAPEPEIIVSRVVQVVLSLLGVAFLGFMMYAGIMWMTAQGNEQKVEKAKNMITESIVGLIIVIAAYAIAFFVINYFSTNSLK